MTFEVTQTTQEIRDFTESLSKKGAKIGAIRVGQQARGAKLTSHFGITLDKKDFAHMMGRVEAYEHIPEAGKFAMYNVQSYIQKYVIPARFESEGKGSGKGWVGLEKSTQEWRKRVGVNSKHPILQVKGFYKDAIYPVG